MIDDVLIFWFEELTPRQWFMKDDAIDNDIKERFESLHLKAAQGELSDWRKTAKGALAEIIILDQFSRNLFRYDAKSFACDPMALTLAQFAIEKNLDKSLTTTECGFLYMPFMHSESLKIHKKALELFDKPGLEGNLDFEKQHLTIIENFGRYPHRNEILNRLSTADEIKFLSQPGSSF